MEYKKYNKCTKIHYPFLLKCCEFIDDVFWINLFQDLAYNIPPQGTYISNDFLCCGYKNKEFRYKLEDKDEETIFNEIYKLLVDKMGTVSNIEKKSKRIAFFDMEKRIYNNNSDDWNSIKQKISKENKIEIYVCSLQKKHNWSIEKTRKVLSYILTCIQFKHIEKDDIIYNNHKITDIKGIDLNSIN